MAASVTGGRGVVGIATAAGGCVQSQEQRCSAACKVVQDGTIGDRQVWMSVFLPQVPAGQHRTQRIRSSHERREPRESNRIARTELVAASVERLDVDSLVRVGDELFLERSSLERCLGQRSPLVIANRREVILDREFFAEALRHSSLGI